MRLVCMLLLQQNCLKDKFIWMILDNKELSVILEKLFLTFFKLNNGQSQEKKKKTTNV